MWTSRARLRSAPEEPLCARLWEIFSTAVRVAEVSYIDSGGLGDLVVSFVRVSKRNGQLKLLNLNDKHRDVLEITRLIDVIQHFSDETEAVNSFDTDSSSSSTGSRS